MYLVCLSRSSTRGIVLYMNTIIEFIRGISDGGAETLVKDYALLLERDLFQVKIVVLFQRHNCANSRILKENNIEVIEIYKNWNALTRCFNKICGWWYVPYRMKKIVHTFEPVAIHSHMTVLKYLKPISHALQGTRLFYTCHSLPERYIGKEQPEERKAAQYLLKKNKLRMIALHNEMAQEINAMFDIEDTVVIHNGIDFKRFQNVNESKEDIRKTLNMPNNVYLIGHVGRFHPLKNHPFIIEVFCKVIEKNENARLLLVGAGEELDNINELIKVKGLSEKVTILSNRTDVPRLMKAMDVFVFPSIAEGLGIVLIEAQICGLRCVVSTAVPEAAYVTELVIPMDLNDSVDNWCNVILDESKKGSYSGCIDDYDMNKEIRKLEKLYLGKE